VTHALRAVALLLCLAAGPWFVWAVFEAAELQAAIDARVMEAGR
jgi:hypothetical protein